jgi:hypothetical protein
MMSTRLTRVGRVGQCDIEVGGEGLFYELDIVRWDPPRVLTTVV